MKTHTIQINFILHIGPQETETFVMHWPRDSTFQLHKMRMPDELYDKVDNIVIDSIEAPNNVLTFPTLLLAILPMRPQKFIEAVQTWTANNPGLPEDRCPIQEGGVPISASARRGEKLSITLRNTGSQPVTVSLSFDGLEHLPSTRSSS